MQLQGVAVFTAGGSGGAVVGKRRKKGRGRKFVCLYNKQASAVGNSVRKEVKVGRVEGGVEGEGQGE